MSKQKFDPYPDLPDDNPITDNANLTFEGKPFWCGNSRTVRDCCFNHIIGLPVKNGIEHPIYDYEEEMLNAIQHNKHVMIKKARGIGATEFMIRYLSWLALSTDKLNDKSVFIIAGTRLEFANEVKERMERLFTDFNVVTDSKYTQCYINTTKFKVFPTKNLKDVRGHIDVAYLFIDEADYFNPKEQNELKYVIKSYEEKSKGKIIMVSTAGESGGLFEQIENDPNSDFKKVYMLVNKGKGKIFDDKFLEEQKEKDPAFFAREYEGKYGYGMGNVFLPEEIEACCELYQPTKINHDRTISAGIDPGFGSSKFAITILMLEDNILKVLYAKEFDRASYEEMINLVTQLKYQYGPVKVYVDGSKPDFIRSLKIAFRETVDYERIIQDANREKVDYEYRMKIIPISFNEWGRELLGRFQHVVSKKWFALSNIEHKELVTQMRMARFKDNGNLDKAETSNNTYDVFDSTRLALKMFEMGRKR
jgi:hypothetical protein